MAQKKQTATTRLYDARARMYRDLIFESAEFVFGEKGFEGAAMQDIAAEAGVSLKTVYSSFSGKQELFTEIMRVRGRAMMDAISEARKSAHGPLAKLEASTRAFVHFMFEHSDWMRIHLRSRLSWAVRPGDGPAAELWQQGQDGYCEILREGMDAGVFWPDDPVELASIVQAVTKVQVSHAVENGESDPEAVADRAIERITRLVCSDSYRIRGVG